MRTRLTKMASKSLTKISRCIASIRQSLTLYTKIDQYAISRTGLLLVRRSLSIAAARVKTKEDAVDGDHRNKNKLQILSDFENRNPRNPEYFGYNKPRGFATQKYRKDFYNK